MLSEKELEARKLRFCQQWGPQILCAMLSNPNVKVQERLTDADRNHLSTQAYQLAQDYYDLIED